MSRQQLHPSQTCVYTINPAGGSVSPANPVSQAWTVGGGQIKKNDCYYYVE